MSFGILLQSCVSKTRQFGRYGVGASLPVAADEGEEAAERNSPHVLLDQEAIALTGGAVGPPNGIPKSV